VVRRSAVGFRVSERRVHLFGVLPFGSDGQNDARELAPLFRQASPGVWELQLKEPIRSLERGKLLIQISDHDRNVTRIERTFSVGR